VHPECTPEVIEAADRALSTEGMIRYAKESEKKEFIIGTEIGILYRLRKECPGKIFYPASDQAVCQNMKLTTLEKVCLALENMSHEVIVPEEVRGKAKTCIERMLRS
jgi:quinolinate synthase